MRRYLIKHSYASLRREYTWLPASDRSKRIFRALCRLEERASYRRVYLEENADALPLDLAFAP